MSVTAVPLEPDALAAVLELARRRLEAYTDIWAEQRATGKLGFEIDVKDGRLMGKVRIVFVEHVSEKT